MTLEEAISQLTTLQEQFAEMKKANEEQTTTIENMKKTNEDLTKTNNKLFLSITGNGNSSMDNEENEEQEYIDFVGDKIWNVLSKSEKEQLKIILNGEDE